MIIDENPGREIDINWITAKEFKKREGISASSFNKMKKKLPLGILGLRQGVPGIQKSEYMINWGSWLAYKKSRITTDISKIEARSDIYKERAEKTVKSPQAKQGRLKQIVRGYQKKGISLTIEEYQKIQEKIKQLKEKEPDANKYLTPGRYLKREHLIINS